MHCVMPTPIRPLRIDEADGAITAVTFTDAPLCPPQTPLLGEAFRQLNAYFDGTLKAFTLPVHLKGTAFRLKCWAALCAIPYGETISYGEQARRIGQPSAVRAVGGANHHNPIAIVVPCHRVISADGTLTGYGGGLDTKAWLLQHERRHAAQYKEVTP